jgi:hypothetical protein
VVRVKKRRVGWVLGSEKMWIAPQLFNCKYSELKSTVISKKGSHDFALNNVDIVL